MSSQESSSQGDGLCDYERQRLENIRQNQEILKQLGFTVKSKPAAPKQKKKLLKKRSRQDSAYNLSSEESCSSSEDEWSLWKEEQQRRKPRKKGFAKRKYPQLESSERLRLMKSVNSQVEQRFQQVLNPDTAKENIKPPTTKRNRRQGKQQSPDIVPPSLPDCFNSDLSDGEDFLGFKAEDVVNEMPDFGEKQFEMEARMKSLFVEDDCEEEFVGFTKDEVGATVIPKEFSEVKTYPKREKAKKTYKEDVISDEDEYLYCEDCGDLHHGNCPIHGPLGEFDPNSGLDKDSQLNTNVPVPAEVTVKTSSIPEAGLGVFAKQYIPRNVKVGPYEGKRVRNDDMEFVEDTSYIWEIRRNGQKAYYIDGRKPEESNWLRFVNCARCEDEQNMVAYQHYGQIFYRTFKHIYPGDELMVWYGEEYARDLGIAMLPGMIPNYKCKGCGSLFVENSTFQLHLRHSKACAIANPQTFKCGKCQETFCELYLLQHHIRNHEYIYPSGKKVIDTIAEDCKENLLLTRAISDKTMSKHVRKPLDLITRNCKSDGKSFKCDYCGRTCASRQSLETHLRTHTGEKPFACEHCGKRFSDQSALIGHLRTHTGEKPFACEHCGRRFNHQSDLKKHLRTHTGEKPFACEHCGQRFSVQVNLKTHLRTHTGEKPFACEHCGQRFNRQSNLKTHLRTHTGEKPFACEYCGQRFNDQSNLKKHLRTHTGEKPFACEHCGKRFSDQSALIGHLRTHTGEKPFACEHCGQRFSVQVNLKTHLRTHTGEKPFACEHCGQRFNRQSNLKTHLRTHTGEKPFACEHCGQRFSVQVNLKTHLRTHTGEKPYKCFHCTVAYGNKSSLNYHVSKHHDTIKCKQSL